jgi:acyl dehydratase
MQKYAEQKLPVFPGDTLRAERCAAL